MRRSRMSSASAGSCSASRRRRSYGFLTRSRRLMQQVKRVEVSYSGGTVYDEVREGPKVVGQQRFPTQTLEALRHLVSSEGRSPVETQQRGVCAFLHRVVLTGCLAESF